MLLEICANSVQSALNAQLGGANRVELCSNLEQGGITPSPASIQLARKYLDIDLFVLIRPRIGDFCYTNLEFEQMQKDILFCKNEGVDGLVFGLLNAQNEIDVFKNKLLVELAGPMQTTFHRAFDCMEKPLENLEKMIDLGFDRILSSGLKASAPEGHALIKKLIEQANERIIILPGGGLNSQNIANFIQQTQATEVHLSAKKRVEPSDVSLFSTAYFETDTAEVQRVSAILNKF